MTLYMNSMELRNIHTLNRPYAGLVKCLTVLFILFSTQCFKYINWNPTYAGWCSYFIYVFIAGWTFLYRNRLSTIYMPLKKELWMLIILFLLGNLMRIILNTGYSLYDERQYIFGISVFLFYYIFYVYNMEEQDIIDIFLVIALCVFCIQIFQIVFPERAIFGIYDEEKRISSRMVAEVRNGIYRFRLSGVLFTLFCLYYYWNKLLVRIRWKNAILFSVLFASMYLYLTRQIIFATLFTLAFSFLFIRNSSTKLKAIAIITACGLVALYFISDLFGEFYTRTLNESNAENIRLISLKFYWEKIVSSPFSFLFGYGHPQFLQKWAKLGLYSNDIGFIGEMFHYGLLWILFYFYTVYLIVLKYGRMLPLYIRLFVFGTSVNSILIFPYRAAGEYFVWASMLYIASLYIARYQTIVIENNTEKYAGISIG